MGKSARADNARLAALRAEQARQERRSKLLIAGGAVGVIVVIIVALVIAAMQGAGKDADGKTGTPLDQATFSKLTTVPAGTFDKVGVGTASNLPKTIDAPAISKDGKPRVVYVGAEYCPFCADQRWPVVVALSRFGTWNNLNATYSAPAPETNPDTPTVSFHGATFTSQYLTFTGYETETNKKSNGQFTKLDTIEGDDLTLFQTYNNKPYVTSPGAIPWLNFGGTSLVAGASFANEAIAGKTHAEIAAGLADPNTPTSKAIVGSANVFTAQICKLTDQKPAEVCTSAGVTAAAAALK